jgi:acetylornithine/LysW-gamma-L-lysine aminotransferase
MKNYVELETQYTSGVYSKREVCFVRGNGMRMWDDTGKEYLDFGTGISVANLGHAHPALVAAIAEQAATLMTAPELGYNDKRAQLLATLAEVTPAGLDRFFLCNSGTEAIEAAIKFARLATGRHHFVATMRGFHGRTLGALAATHNAKYREPFKPLVADFAHVPFGNSAKLTAVVNDETAAVILEPVQGEGGVRVGNSRYFKAVRQLCDRHGALLIVDEVQTGMGRTGTLFASEQLGIQPDIIALGKALAGGVPMGATGFTQAVADALSPGLHGSTFGGNPLACAAALATFDVIEAENLVENARVMGAYFQERLSEINSPLIREVRGIGLMIGVEMKVRVTPILQALMERGYMVLNAGATVLRFLPPLTITHAEIDALITTLAGVLLELESDG